MLSLFDIIILYSNPVYFMLNNEYSIFYNNYYKGTPDLASKVVSPLLSADAKDLLINCLTSKEADLWMSLGDSWSVSR